MDTVARITRNIERQTIAVETTKAAITAFEKAKAPRAIIQALNTKLTRQTTALELSKATLAIALKLK